MPKNIIDFTNINQFILYLYIKFIKLYYFRYKIAKGGDLEASNAEFDPFKARKLEHPVS